MNSCKHLLITSHHHVSLSKVRLVDVSICVDEFAIARGLPHRAQSTVPGPTGHGTGTATMGTSTGSQLSQPLNHDDPHESYDRPPVAKSQKHPEDMYTWLKGLYEAPRYKLKIGFSCQIIISEKPFKLHSMAILTDSLILKRFDKKAFNETSKA